MLGLVSVSFCAEGVKKFFASHIPISKSIIISICCSYKHEDNVKLTRSVQKTTSPASRIPSCSKSVNEFRWHICHSRPIFSYRLHDCAPCCGLTLMWLEVSRLWVDLGLRFCIYDKHFLDMMGLGSAVLRRRRKKFFCILYSPIAMINVTNIFYSIVVSTSTKSTLN